MSQEANLSQADTEEIIPGPEPASIEEEEEENEGAIDAVSQAWADQLDVADPPSPTLIPPSIATAPPLPTPAPLLPPPITSVPSAEQLQIVEVVRLQSARLSQLEDVMNRYQMITDQTLARLDCGFQRMETNHNQIVRDIVALKTARDAIFDELGFEKMQTRIAASAHTPPPQTFGRGGYRTERQPEPRYEYDSPPWQTQPPRRGRGGRR